MRSRPMLLKLFTHALGDQVHRQPGSVGRHDGAGLSKLRHSRQQFPLDLQILRDHFNNPVGLGAPRQVVLKISNRDSLRERCGKERRWLRLPRRL